MIGAWYILPMIITSCLGIVGTIFGGVMTYRTSKRTASGTVETSNANELWTENSRLVDRLGKEIDRLNKDVDMLRSELGKLSIERDELRGENVALRHKMHALEIEMIKFHSESYVTTPTPPVIPPPTVVTTETTSTKITQTGSD